MTDSSKIRAKQKQVDDFVQRQIKTANTLEDVLTQASSSLLVWNDRDYLTEITDADLSNYWFDKSELTAFVGMLNQLVNFSMNQPVQQGNYQSVNNQIKDIN